MHSRGWHYSINNSSNNIKRKGEEDSEDGRQKWKRVKLHEK